MNQRKIAIPDLVFAAAGLLAVISTFLPWWSYSAGGFSVSVNGWNSASAGDLNRTITGPLVWIPMLLLFVLGALALIRALAAPQLLPGKLFYQVGTGVGGFAVLLVVLRWMTYYSPPAGDGGSSGASFGTYLGLLLGLATAGVGVWALRQPQLTAVQGAQAGGGFGGYQQPGQFGGYPQQQQYGQQQQPYAQQPQQPYPQSQGQPQYGQPVPQQGYPQQPQQPQYAQPAQPQQYGQHQPGYAQPQPQPGYPQQPQPPQNYGQPPQFGQQPQQGQPQHGHPDQQPPASWQ